MKRRFLVWLIAIMMLLCACNDSSVGQDPYPSSQTTIEEPDSTDGSIEIGSNGVTVEDTTTSFENISITSYDDIDTIYQFDLNGKHYTLPCSISDFLDNGDIISERDLAYIVPSNHIVGQIYVHPDGIEDAKIELSVQNDSDQDLSVSDCGKVVGITVRDDSNVEVVLNSDITVDLSDDGAYTFLENLQKNFGTEKPIYKEDQYSCIWNFYKKINSEYDNANVFGLFPGMDEIKLSNTGFTMKYAGRPDIELE